MQIKDDKMVTNVSLNLEPRPFVVVPVATKLLESNDT